jgi:hypothetical protein
MCVQVTGEATMTGDGDNIVARSMLIKLTMNAFIRATFCSVLSTYHRHVNEKT